MNIHLLNASRMPKDDSGLPDPRKLTGEGEKTAECSSWKRTPSPVPPWGVLTRRPCLLWTRSAGSLGSCTSRSAHAGSTGGGRVLRVCSFPRLAIFLSSVWVSRAKQNQTEQRAMFFRSFKERGLGTWRHSVASLGGLNAGQQQSKEVGSWGRRRPQEFLILHCLAKWRGLKATAEISRVGALFT